MLLDSVKSRTRCVAILMASYERHDKNTENIVPSKEKKNAIAFEKKKNYIKFGKLPPLKHYFNTEYTRTSLQFTSPKFHSYIGLHISFSFACSYLVLRPNDKSGNRLERLCCEHIKRII